jgi:hypothetical protein
MPYRRAGETILTRWRQVERDLNLLKGQYDDVAPATAVAAYLRSEVDGLLNEWAGLRIEYEHLIDEARRRHRALPPTWPEPAS